MCRPCYVPYCRCYHAHSLWEGNEVRREKCSKHPFFPPKGSVQYWNDAIFAAYVFTSLLSKISWLNSDSVVITCSIQVSLQSNSFNFPVNYRLLIHFRHHLLAIIIPLKCRFTRKVSTFGAC